MKWPTPNKFAFEVLTIFYSLHLIALNKSNNCPSPCAKCSRMERISPTTPVFFPDSKSNPQKVCTRSLDKLSIQFLKCAESIESNNELQNPTFLLTNTALQGCTVRSKGAEGSQNFYTLCRKLHPATSVSTALVIICSNYIWLPPKVEKH